MNPSADDPLVPCPHCTELYRAGETVCPHCGKEIPAEAPTKRGSATSKLGRVMYGPPRQSEDLLNDRIMYGPALYEGPPQPDENQRAMYGPAPYAGPVPWSPLAILALWAAGLAAAIGVVWWCWKWWG